MKTIAIHIGSDTINANTNATLWHPVETDAPIDYDGFGTFEVAKYEQGQRQPVQRTVLIRSEHYTWQRTRYESGLHQCKESLHDEAAIADFLWLRLRGKELEVNQ